VYREWDYFKANTVPIFQVEMPSFVLEFKKNLQKLLPKIGFGHGFSDNANFSRVSKLMRYKLKNAVHWAKIEVSLNPS
jgi:serine protease inhibitor